MMTYNENDAESRLLPPVARKTEGRTQRKCTLRRPCLEDCVFVDAVSGRRGADAGRIHENDRYEQERSAETFVGFASRWLPYGGADGETIFVMFGISGAEYRRRLWWALTLPGGPDIDRDILGYARGHHALITPSGLG